MAKVFDTWRELLPLHQEGALGRTWQEAAKGLSDKKSGMYLLGMFVGQQFSEGEAARTSTSSTSPRSTPTSAPTRWTRRSTASCSPRSPRTRRARRRCWSTSPAAEAQNTYLASDPNNIATAKDADTSAYSALQKKAVELIGGASNITQFMDRDTRPDFASTVMIPSIQDFIKNPNDVAGLAEEDRGPEEDDLHLVTVVTGVTEQAAGAEAARAASAGSRRADKLVLVVMCGVPTLLLIAFVWFPALASVGLSFTSWDGIGGIGTIKWVGVQNYDQIVSHLPAVLARLPPQPHLAGVLRRCCRRRSGSSSRCCWTSRSASAASTRARSICR